MTAAKALALIEAARSAVCCVSDSSVALELSHCAAELELEIAGTKSLIARGMLEAADEIEATDKASADKIRAKAARILRAF